MLVELWLANFPLRFLKHDNIPSGDYLTVLNWSSSRGIASLICLSSTFSLDLSFLCHLVDIYLSGAMSRQKLRKPNLPIGSQYIPLYLPGKPVWPKLLSFHGTLGIILIDPGSLI